MDSQKGLNILVCGSKNFSDKNFVFGMLDNFYKLTEGNIKQVFTSNFSGTCEFAREWVTIINEQISFIAHKNNEQHPPFLKLKDCTFDMLLSDKNTSLYEQVNIPEFIIQNDPYFIKGKNLIQENNINMILAFPNPEGILGPSTYNIKRFAKLAGIGQHILDCSDALKQLNNFRIKEQELVSEETTGFSNKHPGRKF